ncbi:gfo/Idh/MocA family oxidoreductase [Bacteroidetes/Chlorobi group bacterium Naka2016]|jgi:predicted dehydrogenase|nr:MAG: gfo/Idh/MocA family oxidoreductase [Bacteroidetes/Chlorobi group bacterium Naka2016]
MEKANKVKVSVIGVGHLGTIHTKLLLNNEYCELVGIYDSDINKSKQLANELGCRVFFSFEEVAKNSEAVIISSPTTTHFEIAKYFLTHSIHCFIEKPITAKYKEALRLIELGKTKNAIIQVGHVERFNPALKSVMKYSPEPLFIESHRLSQFKPRAIDVSVISDLMIHDLDIVLWLVKSKVKRIHANGVPVLTDTIDIANARIEFENGAVANLTASRISAKPMRKMRFFQKQAYFSIDFANQSVEIYKIQDNSDTVSNGGFAFMLGNINESPKKVNIYFEKIEAEQGNAIVDEHNSFFRAILYDEQIPVSAFDASQALRLSEAIETKIIKSLKPLKV